jgi:hypothetical protein
MEQRPFKWDFSQRDLSYTEGHTPIIPVISSTSTQPTFDERLRTYHPNGYHSISLPLAPLLH